MSANSQNIVFEYPLNESIRICLRLENLFNVLHEHVSEGSSSNIKNGLILLLQLLDVIDRPDLKSKLAQMLTQQAMSLAPLEHLSNIDAGRLKKILAQLDELINNLHINRSKIGERLRNNEFLSQIRLQRSNPGGVCIIKSPAYLLWQKRPAEERLQDLKLWSSELDELKKVVEWILKLTRESASPQTIVAEKGFHSQSLDPTIAGQLVRIALANKLNVYPEVSVGRHRLTVHFLRPNFHENGRSVPSRETIEFELSCCKL